MRNLIPRFCLISLFSKVTHPSPATAVFGKRKITDKAKFADRHQYSEGFDYVVANGVVAVAAGAKRAGLVSESHHCKSQ